jgi:hypothetical protein
VPELIGSQFRHLPFVLADLWARHYLRLDCPVVPLSSHHFDVSAKPGDTRREPSSSSLDLPWGPTDHRSTSGLLLYNLYLGQIFVHLELFFWRNSPLISLAFRSRGRLV